MSPSPQPSPRMLPDLASQTRDSGFSTEIAPGVWHAFDLAVEETGRRLSSAVSAQELLPFLDSVKESVRCVVASAPVEPQPPPPSVSAGEVIESVRRRFVDEVHVERAANAQQAIHILSALGRVQCILDVAGREQAPELLAGRDAGSLLIEIAHDMRSPLAAILFLLDMLRSERSGPMTSVQQQQLRLIYGASLGIMQLACDMIDSVRGAERLVGEEPVAFSVAEMLNSVREIVHPMAEEKGVEVELVQPRVDARIGLATAINRILLNLTSNAIKFSTNGVVKLGATEISATAIEFSVQDSGREIPRQVMEQLFRPFRHSVVRRTRTFSSAGLGLSICHKLTLAMGSELHVSTSATEGTRFYFVLDLPPVDG